MEFKTRNFNFTVLIEEEQDRSFIFCFSHKNQLILISQPHDKILSRKEVKGVNYIEFQASRWFLSMVPKLCFAKSQ